MFYFALACDTLFKDAHEELNGFARFDFFNRPIDVAFVLGSMIGCKSGGDIGGNQRNTCIELRSPPRFEFKKGEPDIKHCLQSRVDKNFTLKIAFP